MYLTEPVCGSWRRGRSFFLNGITIVQWFSILCIRRCYDKPVVEMMVVGSLNTSSVFLLLCPVAFTRYATTKGHETWQASQSPISLSLVRLLKHSPQRFPHSHVRPSSRISSYSPTPASSSLASLDSAPEILHTCYQTRMAWSPSRSRESPLASAESY